MPRHKSRFATAISPWAPEVDDASAPPQLPKPQKRGQPRGGSPAPLKFVALSLVTAVAFFFFATPAGASDLRAGCTQTSGDDVTLSNPGGVVTFDGKGVDGYADDASQTARGRARAAYADLGASEDCAINLRFGNTLAVGPGSTGLANGEPVRLTVTLQLNGTVLTAPPSSSGGSLAEMIATYEVSQAIAAPDPSAEAWTSLLLGFRAEFEQQHYASGATNLYRTERLELESNVGEPLWQDESYEAFHGGEVSAPYEVNSLTATFETTVGAELTISAYLSTLASAYGSGAVAESDFFKSLQAAVAPASGFEGLQLLYGDTAEPQDTTPPLLTVPGTITVDANSPQGAEVSYEPSANDDTDPHPVVSCDVPSGSLFPIGSTTVTCTATDTAGNSSEPQHFEVVVNGAAEQLIGLVSLVESFELDKGITTSLGAKLHAAVDAVHNGDIAASCSEMQAFRNHVEALSGNKLTANQANQLNSAAVRIEAVLGCSSVTAP